MLTHNGFNGKTPDVNSKKRGKWLFLLLAALVLAVYFIGIPYYRLSEADKLSADGKIQDAAELYSKYRNHFVWKEKATEGYIAVKTELAASAVAEQDYDQAIEIYRELGNEEKAKELQAQSADFLYERGEYEKAAILYGELGNTVRAHMSWSKYGDKLLQSGKYEEAITAFTNAQNENKIQNSHFTWAESLANAELFDEAAEHYIQAGRGDKAREIMIEKSKQMIINGDPEGIIDVLKPYKGQDVAELLFQAQKVGFDSPDNEDAIHSARKYGESISDPEMLLYYCYKLHENSYDLKKVFSTGVPVKMDLAQYQIYNPNDENDPGEPDYSKIIVFSRQDAMPDLTIKSTTRSADVDSASNDNWEKRLNGQYDYSVKLHPELMADLLDGQQAWNIDDCTAYIILDEGYLPLGSISIRTTTTSSSRYGALSSVGSTSYKILYYYAAYSSITVYDKTYPQRFANYDVYIDYPLAASAVVGNAYSDTGIDLTGLQLEEIQGALNDKDSEESQKILAKYDKKTIEFVEQNGWGDYILIPDRDDHGEQKNFKGTSSNITSWNIPQYMLGHKNDAWITEKIDDGAMSSLSLYFLLSDLNNYNE